ncbi:MAG: protein-ADP-ribose hydrolase [Clostridia bacterium]|nr:protein-ADP-ribose hydrolase [Clostridia bacterium]
MTQTQRRLWLIQYLLSESERYKNIQIPADGTEQFNLYRSLVNVRTPAPISEEYLQVEDEYLKEETAHKGITPVTALDFDNDIAIWQGDITTLACDAIVNAANSKLLGCFCPCHGCIDNCIHTFAGVRLRLKCNELMKNQLSDEPTGKAKITPAYNLPCKYVLHTVGPIVYGELTEKHEALLASSYEACLKLADENGLESIAFCCISTGEFHFPNDRAAEIAVQTVKKYKTETNSGIKVIFNIFKNKDKEIYEQLLG